MKRRLLCVLAAVSSAVSLTGMDWPSSDGRLIENFGMNNGGRPVIGDTFLAQGDVYSADPGEILFNNQEDDGGTFISPLGNWVACDHGDGYISIYARLSELSTEALPERVDKGVTIGKAGKSGWSSGGGFHFSFFDRRERQWINPIVILNSMPDTIAPSIQSIKLKDSSGKLYDLSSQRLIRQGLYSVLVQASDRIDISNAALAPFCITTSLNGVEAGRLELETFSARDGGLLIYSNGLVPVTQIYGSAPALEAAGNVSFSRGQARLDLGVLDFAGNARNASFNLFIE
ncbi:MAG: M23 family metallopeptidase [Spirochaetaceae bacterium]|jgi:hypothetical protein|nr:M23 family metallopeptidase [Spirochaetaceae bacterium]